MRPPITASLPPSDTGSHAPAPKDDARPNTRAGLDRAQGERPAARQKQAAPLLLEPQLRRSEVHPLRGGPGRIVRRGPDGSYETAEPPPTA
jgi:hypothetical protein